MPEHSQSHGTTSHASPPAVSAAAHAPSGPPSPGSSSDAARHAFPTQDLARLKEEFLRPRLFMQLQVFTGASDLDAVTRAVEASGLEAVVYRDFLDPRGVGVLLMAEDPQLFVAQGRVLFNAPAFASLVHRTQLAMTGCTYSTGRDPTPDDWMVQRPRRNARNPAWDWTVWYPLRRKPEFATLPREEQGKLLFEHAMMAKPYGDIETASDIRLSCYGIDTNDNEFVIGLVGPQLYPLSHLIAEMRKSQQTAKYIQSLGPFFVGRVHWRKPV